MEEEKEKEKNLKFFKLEKLEIWKGFDEFINLISKQSFNTNECVNLNDNEFIITPNKMNCKDEVSTYFCLFGMEKLEQIVKECENWLDSFPRNQFPNPKKLTYDEMFAIAMFTHELRPQGKEYENFYFQLRFTKNLKQFGGYLYFLEMAMSRFENQQMTVYRGFHSSNLEGVKKKYSNSQISLKTFISTTTDISLAQKAAKNGGIIMEINIKEGKNITEYAFLKNESEIVLTPNMVFIVSEELHKEDDGYFHLKLTQTG